METKCYDVMSDGTLLRTLLEKGFRLYRENDIDHLYKAQEQSYTVRYYQSTLAYEKKQLLGHMHSHKELQQTH